MCVYKYVFLAIENKHMNLMHTHVHQIVGQDCTQIAFYLWKEQKNSLSKPSNNCLQSLMLQQGNGCMVSDLACLNYNTQTHKCNDACCLNYDYDHCVLFACVPSSLAYIYCIYMHVYIYTYKIIKYFFKWNHRKSKW